MKDTNTTTRRSTRLPGNSLKGKALAFALLSCLPMGLVSCDREEPKWEQEGLIAVSVTREGDTTSTRAISDTSIYGREAAIRTVEVLVFDATGTLEGYESLGTSMAGTVTCKAGTGKTVCVAANAPASLSLSSITTLSQYNSLNVELAAANDTTTSFVMFGSASGVSVTKDTATPVPITISKLVSRITLKSITSALPASYGSMTINNVFISNVVANQSPAANATPSTWYNPMGRKNENTLSSGHIVDGLSYAASAPKCTFRALSGVSLASGASHTNRYRFYCYPNPTASDTQGFSTTMTARYTRLVITATILGQKYYYPINIPQPLRNTCYDVSVTLLHLGSNDPDVAVATGTANIEITAAGWDGAPAINENI